MTETVTGPEQQRQTEGPGPLAGVRVVELGMLLAGPFAGRLLGDMGAEIIKVEPPGQPDPLREWGKARYEGRSLWWPVQSRNKKCVTLNLRAEEGQKLLLRLVEHCDVLVENFRPGTLEKWGLGPEQLWEVNPKLVIARVSGYGQTGPYSRRAGFASVAEAMGGIRYINGFPGEPPPRIHISLGDSLAGMFAVQGILAALYRRDALGGGRGQVVDVSLMEACFALLESMVPEYDRLEIVRGPGGTGLAGVAPSNIFKSSDDAWMVIAANADGVFRRLCAAMDQPELADDPKYATHLARGENQEELEGIVADWAGRHTAAEIDRLLNDAGVICGPIYTIADIFEDEQFQAREMLVKHVDPEFGEYFGPGIVPKFSETPGEVRWSATWEEGSHNRDVYGGSAGPLRRRAGEPRAGGCAVTVTICDVAPRDGLQNDERVFDPETRAELVNRLAAAGLRRIETVSFVNPARVPQMGGAEEVVAAIDRRDGVVYAGLVLNEKGYDRLAATGLDEAHFAFASTETLNRRNQNASVAESVEVAARIVERAHADGIRATVTIGTAFGCPFEGAVDPGYVLELASLLADAGADEIVLADTVGVGVPRQVKHLVSEAAKLSPPIGVHLHNTRNTGFANAYVALEAGATVLDASVGGIGGCPFAPRATGNICTEDLVYLLHGEGIETGIDLDELITVAEWLEAELGRELPGQVYRAGTFAPVAG